MKGTKWDIRFMNLAKEIAKWSSCIRNNRQVGCVIVRDNKVITTGYNGAPTGIRTCRERGECIRDKLGIPSGTRSEVCYSVHAEQNAIIQAARDGVSLVGTTIYVTHQPCNNCAKMIINAGIEKVVYLNGYPDNLALEICKEAKLNLIKYSDLEFDEK